MKHKVSDLEGALLDAAVERAGGWVDGLDNGSTIERERITVQASLSGNWRAIIGGDGASAQFVNPRPCETRGPTPLIAAMRAYVFYKFGDEVEL